MQDLQKIIEDAWEIRAELKPGTAPAAQALTMALPMNTVERLAEVDESNGTTEVSPITITTRSG